MGVAVARLAHEDHLIRNQRRKTKNEKRGIPSASSRNRRAKVQKQPLLSTPRKDIVLRQSGGG